MATVTELNGELQSLLKKAGATTANTDDALKWYNELRRRLQKKVKIQDIWTLSLVLNTEEYTLTGATYPIYILEKVFHIVTGATTGREYPILPINRRYENGVRWRPARGDQTDHTLWVWPKTLTGSLELHGLRRMAVLTSGSTPEIDEAFHDLFPLWGACRFGGQDEDFASAGRFPQYEKQFLRREAEFIASQSVGTRPHRVRVKGW